MSLNSILRVDVFLHTVKGFSVVVMVQTCRCQVLAQTCPMLAQASTQYT